MKKDEYIQMLLSMVEEHRQIILLLKEQHQKDKTLIAELKDKISLLTCELSEMRRILSKAMKINEAKIKAEMKKMEERLEEYKDELQKEKNKAKGLAKCLGNKSEKQKQELSKEELAKKREAQKKKRKARGNNGAKRNPHFELETKIINLYPDDPNFDMDKAHEIFGKDENGNVVLKTSMRLDYIPGKVIKTLYNIHRYKCNGEFYQGSAPNAVLLNSNYTASFVAMITYQRYINSMSVYRINKMFNDFGFDSKEKTFHSLMRGTATRLEPLVNAMKEEVHDSQYIAADETYFKVLVPKEENERGSRKGYFWMYFSPKKNAVYVDYQKGSRATVVAESMLHDFKGTLQSDGYTAYKKLSNKYEFIKRIACIQHIKRKFIDCGEDEEAGKFVDLFNQLYQKDHMHVIGEDGWTAAKHKKWRQEYAPPILDEIEKLAKETKEKEILPNSELSKAVRHLLNEMDAVRGIFTEGETRLDNNAVERLNRYISLARHNSLFCGSHEGADRCAIFYTLALTCKQNDINFYEYLTYVLEKTAAWQPSKDLLKYKELLPQNIDKEVLKKEKDRQ